jgi:hypothetical protein
MSKGERVPKDPRQGGPIWNWIYKYLMGPPQVEHAVHGCTAEARDYWKRDLEMRRAWSREQRERKRAAREATGTTFGLEGIEADGIRR